MATAKPDPDPAEDLTALNARIAEEGAKATTEPPPPDPKPAPKD